MTDTDRMVVWLRETLDAAQADAEAAARAFPEWDYDEFVKEVRDVPNAGTVAFIAVTQYGPHIARQSPAAVLRRIAADRETLEWCTEVIGDTDLSNYEQFGSLRDHPQALAVTLAVETIRNLTKGWGWKGGQQ